jgi:hypothetical protein
LWIANPRLKHPHCKCGRVGANLFKDPAMLKRFQDISVLPEKESLLTTVDHFIKASKISLM